MEIDTNTKTYVVTGATSGIGLATAEALARAGASVIGVGRSAERCRDAEQRLQSLNPRAQYHYLLADLSSQAEVNRLADQIFDLLAAQGKSSLDGLVNNAGTFTYWLSMNPAGIEMQWAVNHLAPFHLTLRLLPLLKSASFARVVTVSSDSHYSGRMNWEDLQLRRHYNGLQAYGNTKLANILFTLALNQRLGASSSVRAFAVDPGLVKTDIGMKGTPAIVRWAWGMRRSGGTPPEVPARGIVYLLTDPALQDSTELYWKDSHPKRASRFAQDALSASRLWAISGKMCGLREEVEYGTL
ncbi:MAG TPA: SDR family NAD(P)-dependent oxidoreductase [Anaerolineaceae bacterium]